MKTDESKQNVSEKYYLITKSHNSVCLNILSSTLGITENFVRYWLNFPEKVITKNLVAHAKQKGYYKTNLCVHNFTIYYLESKRLYCYWYDDYIAGLVAFVYKVDEKLLPVIS